MSFERFPASLMKHLTRLDRGVFCVHRILRVGDVRGHHFEEFLDRSQRSSKIDSYYDIVHIVAYTNVLTRGVRP